MPIDTSMYAGIKGPAIESPLNALTQVAALQHYQNQNALAPLQQQQMSMQLRKAQQQIDLMGEYAAVGNQPDNTVANVLANGAQSGSLGPTVANANALAAAPTQTQNVAGQRLAMLDRMAAAGIDTHHLFEQLKYQIDGSKRDAGAYYKDPVTGTLKYYGNPKDGLTIDDSGNVVPMPGAPTAMAEITGSTEGAKQRAINQNTLAPLDRIDPSTGRPYAATVDQLVRSVTGGQPPATPQQSPVNLPPIPPQLQEQIDYVRGANDPKIRENFLQVVGTAINNGNQPQAVKQAMLQKVTQLVSAEAPAAPGQLGSGTFNGFAGPADQERSVGQIKADIEVQKQREIKDAESRDKAVKLSNQMKAAIPMARDLLNRATGSGIGAMYDKGAAFFGASTDGADAASQLKTLGGWMTSNVPRMEGPQSDKDVLVYSQMAAKVADDNVPISQRLAALDTLEALQNKYAKLNGGAQTVPASAPSAPGKPAATPKAGMVEDGYRFKGGNPADPKNWVRM